MPKNPKPALRSSNDRLQQELLSVVTKSLKPNKKQQDVKALQKVFLEEKDLQNNKESNLYQLLQKAWKEKHLMSLKNDR
ncbi:MAG: hypothetical protein ACTHJ5_16000 [Ilyomonas sp.]